MLIFMCVCMYVHISIIHAGLSIKKKNDIGVWWLLENYNSAFTRFALVYGINIWLKVLPSQTDT